MKSLHVGSQHARHEGINISFSAVLHQRQPGTMCPDTPAKVPRKVSLGSHVQPCFSSASRTAELAYLREVSHRSSWWPCFWSLGPTLATEPSGTVTRPWRDESNPYKSINQAWNLGGGGPCFWNRAMHERYLIPWTPENFGLKNRLMHWPHAWAIFPLDIWIEEMSGLFSVYFHLVSTEEKSDLET